MVRMVLGQSIVRVITLVVSTVQFTHQNLKLMQRRWTRHRDLEGTMHSMWKADRGMVLRRYDVNSSHHVIELNSIAS